MKPPYLVIEGGEMIPILGPKQTFKTFLQKRGLVPDSRGWAEPTQEPIIPYVVLWEGKTCDLLWDPFL